jgi:hypothetical protein
MKPGIVLLSLPVSNSLAGSVLLCAKLKQSFFVSTTIPSACMVFFVFVVMNLVRCIAPPIGMPNTQYAELRCVQKHAF